MNDNEEVMKKLDEVIEGLKKLTDVLALTLPNKEIAASPPMMQNSSFITVSEEAEIAEMVRTHGYKTKCASHEFGSTITATAKLDDYSVPFSIFEICRKDKENVFVFSISNIDAFSEKDKELAMSIAQSVRTKFNSGIEFSFLLSKTYPEVRPLVARYTQRERDHKESQESCDKIREREINNIHLGLWDIIDGTTKEQKYNYLHDDGF